MSMSSHPDELLKPVYRHPLGVPAGSVRAALTLMIVILFWLLLLLPPDKTVSVPLSLYFLLGLVLLFFASHGSSIAEEGSAQASPWYLPRGTFRWLILLGSAAVVGWQWYSHPDVLLERLTLPRDVDRVRQWPFLLLSLTGG